MSIWLCQSCVRQSQLNAGVLPLCCDKKLHRFLQNKYANGFWQVVLSVSRLDSTKFSHLSSIKYLH